MAIVRARAPHVGEGLARDVAVAIAFLGEQSRRAGLPDAARASFEQALRLAPELPEGLTGLGSLALPESPAEARALFERALARDPAFAPALQGLAQALSKQGDAEAAREVQQRLQQVLQDRRTGSP
ncbi:MAG: tetratricopeptide repeat protein [Myxococcales bacterium]